MMSAIPRRLCRQHSLGRLSILRSPIAQSHTSLEKSTGLLLRNRPDDIISTYKERGDRDMNELHPLEKNVYALGMLFNGDPKQSLEVQSQTVKYFTQSLGSTSDSFLDIAGSINDLAVIHIANKDYLSAEKQLKRALLMVERSYRVDTHLRSTLLSNLSNVHRLTGNKELCLQYTDQLLPLLSSNYTVAKQTSVDISNLNPAESQESLDLFWKNLTQLSENSEGPSGGTKEGNKSENGGNGIRDKYYYTKEVFTTIRKVQFSLSAGHCIGTSRLHEEGLIYINKAFEMILLNTMNAQNSQKLEKAEGDDGDLLLRDSFLLSLAVARLGDLADDSTKKRGKGMSAKHIEHDNVSKLFKLPYFQENYPSVSQLDLSLTSPFRDLKNAATQIHKFQSKSASTNKSDSTVQLSEYERVLLSGAGIVGIALLDIEHHCPPPMPADSPDVPDAPGTEQLIN